jgi:hypothetical protein
MQICHPICSEAVCMEIQILQLSQVSETQWQSTIKTIGRDIEMSQITQSSQFSRNRADEPVVGQIQMLMSYTPMHSARPLPICYSTATSSETSTFLRTPTGRHSAQSQCHQTQSKESCRCCTTRCANRWCSHQNLTNW